MLSFADWTSQQSAPKTGGQSPAGPLSLPDWSYDSSDLTIDKYGTLQASNVLQDYYGQLTNGYLPQLDQFAKDNAGQMVAFDPNRFMTAEDFGLGNNGINRGSLRNQDLLQASHDLAWSSNGDSGNVPTYYRQQDGNYYAATGADGEELFTLTNGEDGTQSYTSAGKYHKDTPEEAMKRLLDQGGGYRSGTVNDFMGSESLTGLTKDGSGKWGADYVKDPTLQQYLDDPSWVSKDENGNITNIRAELYPMLMREQLGQEYRDIARGGTKAADGMGDIVKALVMGVATGGLGLAGAQTLGLGTAAAGSSLGATAAGMGYGGLATAGAFTGSLNSALTGGDILKGALTGGLSGGFTKFASPYVGKTLSNMGVTGTANKVLTGGLTGMSSNGLSSAITGNQFNPLSSFTSGATQGYMGSQAGKDFMGGLGITNPYAQQMMTGVLSNTTGTLAAGKNPNMQGTLVNTGIKTFQQWLNDQSRG